MRRYWYTFFLIGSLFVYAYWTDGTEVHKGRENIMNVQTERESVYETEMAENGEIEDEGSVYETRGIAESSMYETEEITESGEMEYFVESDYTNSLAVDIVEYDQPAFGMECLPSDNFQDVLFIGDSRTVGLYEYGQIREADVFADSGMTVFNLWDSEAFVSSKEQKYLEQILMERQYQMIHLMLGINELGYSMQQIVKKYGEAVEKIQRMQPNAKIVLGANLHVTSEHSVKSNIYNNNRINELNNDIQRIAEERDCYFIDVNEIFDDGQGNLSEKYSTDGSHILGKYYADWVQWICNQI